MVRSPQVSVRYWILDRVKQRAGRSEGLRLSSLVDVKSVKTSEAWIICQAF